MPRAPAAWIAPSDVADVKMDLFRAPPENDPRMRNGPCGRRHLDQPMAAEISEPGPYIWRANQHAVWANCPTCDLRVGYWPKKEHSGKYSLNLNPAVVEEALRRIQQTGERCTAKWVKAEIDILDAERRMEQVQKESEDTARAKASAKSTSAPRTSRTTRPPPTMGLTSVPAEEHVVDLSATPVMLFSRVPDHCFFPSERFFNIHDSGYMTIAFSFMRSGFRNPMGQHLVPIITVAMVCLRLRIGQGSLFG